MSCSQAADLNSEASAPTEAACPGGDSLERRGPAAGKGVLGEESAGQVLSPGGECVDEVQARAIGRDVHGHGSPVRRRLKRPCSLARHTSGKST